MLLRFPYLGRGQNVRGKWKLERTLSDIVALHLEV